MARKSSNKLRIPLSAPHISGNEWRYAKKCLDTGWVSSGGKFVNEFESKVAKRIGIRHAVACVNGTSALHISLLIAGISQNDEVIVPTVAFIAPINAVKYVGAIPVFMDCDDYLNIDAKKIKKFISQECSFKGKKLLNKKSGNYIKAILPVHIFGFPVDIEPIMDLAKEFNLKVIEDAAESLGSRYSAGRYKGRYTGTIGDIGCLSFNGNKIITAGGGGMIITNDDKLARKARYLTTQAKDDEARYIHNDVGYNYRLSNLQAAVGVAQLENLSEHIDIKRSNFTFYEKGISKIDGLTLLKEPPYAFSNYWFYSMLVEKDKFGMTNEELMNSISKKGVETRLLWHLNHKQRPYRDCVAYDIENAEKYAKLILNLPCSVGISKGDIEFIVKEIRDSAKN